MKKDELLAVYDRQLRFESSDPLSERQTVTPDAPLVVRHVPLDPNARWGWVIWSRLTEANADQLIAEQVDFFVERGQNFEWKRFGYDGPADLDERLLRHGFNREEHESVMVLDLEEAEALRDERSADVVVCRITDPADLGMVVQIEDAVWHESHAWIAEELRYELMLPDEPLLMYLAYIEGIPASAAWIRFHKGTDFASLFGGSTLPDYRKRGLYSALLAARASDARKRGYRFLSVDASEMSRPILEKRGFVKVTTATAYKYHVSDEPD
jgi:GNAT superfamily N-acetyltransferase